jgi:hypothetical protein
VIQSTLGVRSADANAIPMKTCRRNRAIWRDEITRKSDSIISTTGSSNAIPNAA